MSIRIHASFSVDIEGTETEVIIMDNMDTIMNAMIFIAGGYLLYSAFVMKTKGEVSSSFMGRGIDWKHAKEENKAAYIRVMIPSNIVMGIVMLATAVVFTFSSQLGISGYGETLFVGIALIFCVIYGILIMHFQNKYLK